MSKEKEWSDETKKNLAEWLKSPKGIKQIRKGQEEAKQRAKIYDSMSEVSDEVMNMKFDWGIKNKTI